MWKTSVSHAEESAVVQKTTLGLVAVLKEDGSRHSKEAFPLLSDAEFDRTPIAMLANTQGTLSALIVCATPLLELPTFSTSLGSALGYA